MTARRLSRNALFVVSIAASVLVGCGLWAWSAFAAGSPIPPYTQCPAVGHDTSCQYLVDVTSATATANVYADPAQPQYAGTGETLVGVMNDTTKPLSQLFLGVPGSNDNNFTFDGHGLCSPGVPPVPFGCPFATPAGIDPNDYEGPGTTLAAVDGASGQVSFSPALSPGQSTYLSLRATIAPGVRPLAASITSAAPYLIDQTLALTSTGTGVFNGQLSESGPTDVYDAATLEGNGASSASGSITFTVYSDAACTLQAASPETVALRAGSAVTPTPIGSALATNHVYYWQATLVDPLNGNTVANTPCGQATMAFGSTALPASTLSPALSASSAGWNASVTAAGGASTPTGKAYFTIYSDQACTAQVAALGGAQLANGTASASASATVSPGTYYLQVAYTGDPTHASATDCDPVAATVAGPVTSSTTTTTTTTSTISTASGGPLPPPVLFRTVNVTPVSGKVYVKLPPGAHLSRLLAARGRVGPVAIESLSKGVGFIPLTQARQIPVGSELDTTGGTVAITAANTRKGSTYTGDFTAGLFTLLQNRRDKGVTELDLVDVRSRARVCTSTGKGASLLHGPLAGAARVSSKVLALLKGSDHGGRFSTHGTYSAATTRGTAYSVENECAGTLTKVTRGAVVVDYFKRHHKHLVVTAGHEFLAKASGGPSVVVTIGKRASARKAAAAALGVGAALAF